MEWMQVVNWTDLILAVLAILGTVFAFLLKNWLKQYVVPWLDERDLTQTAAIVVNAVEAILGRHAGEEKWRMALEKMQAAGFNVDDDKVVDALKAEWYKLDLAMREAGLKN